MSQTVARGGRGWKEQARALKTLNEVIWSKFFIIRENVALIFVCRIYTKQFADLCYNCFLLGTVPGSDTGAHHDTVRISSLLENGYRQHSR